MADPAAWAEVEERLQRASESTSDFSPESLDRMSAELERAAQLLIACTGSGHTDRLAAAREEWAERAELLGTLFEMRLGALTPSERQTQGTGWISLEG
jgi:hypothetical protein